MKTSRFKDLVSNFAFATNNLRSICTMWSLYTRMDCNDFYIGIKVLSFIMLQFSQVLSKDFDPSIGGRLFDERLMRHFSAEFKKRYNIDSLTRPRQTMRLTTECERLKKSMGTITQPVSISLDCFADDRDLTGKIKRQVFQNPYSRGKSERAPHTDYVRETCCSHV